MQRGLIVREYFELQGYLNRANKLSNQKSEISFHIEVVGLFEYRVYAISSGPHEIHKLAVAERGRTKNWERTGNTRFNHLEEYCAHFLNTLEDNISAPYRSAQLPTRSLEQWANELTKTFKLVLLNKNYQP